MTQFATVTRSQIEAGIARGRQIRSQYLADRVQELTRALIRRLRGREIVSHLEDLPDYLLRDIGIERDQIPALAAGALRRRQSSLAAAIQRRQSGVVAAQPAAAANDRRRLAA